MVSQPVPLRRKIKRSSVSPLSASHVRHTARQRDVICRQDTVIRQLGGDCHQTVGWRLSSDSWVETVIRQLGGDCHQTVGWRLSSDSWVETVIRQLGGDCHQTVGWRLSSDSWVETVIRQLGGDCHQTVGWRSDIRLAATYSLRTILAFTQGAAEAVKDEF